MTSLKITYLNAKIPQFKLITTAEFGDSVNRGVDKSERSRLGNWSKRGIGGS